MADLVIQRVVFPLNPDAMALYGRVEGEALSIDRHSMVLAPGARLDACAYFNAFFEAPWRRYTALNRLTLRLRVSGHGAVRLWRRKPRDDAEQLAQADFDATDPREIELSASESDGEPGLLCFEIVAGHRAAELVSAQWVAVGVEPAEVRLVAGYCTFHREEFILDNIGLLAGDAGLSDRLARIVVVDQGERKVKDHARFGELSARAAAITSFVEQPNFGGAGGFARCILEAMRLPEATHFLLLDDDAAIEPESVFRAAAMFALAKREFALGGAMFDLLRPTVMYEFGGLVIPWRMGVGRRGRELPVHRLEGLLALCEMPDAHYNAWWFFACPLSVVERLGLPLPLFIRCDDLEFGCRLLRRGIPTVGLPGLGVWHLPFYRKKRSWMDYYSRRNILAAVALHFRPSRFALAAAFLGAVVYRLLSLDYFRAWALCEGMNDYLAGPGRLREDPRGLHHRVLEAHRRLKPAELSKRDHPLPRGEAPRMPDALWRQISGLIVGLARQLLCRSPSPGVLPRCALEEKDEHWYALRRADAAAIDEPDGDVYVVLRRDRGKFLFFLSRAAVLAARFVLVQGSAARRWRRAAGELSSPRFWQAYLGMTDEFSQA